MANNATIALSPAQIELLAEASRQEEGDRDTADRLRYRAASLGTSLDIEDLRKAFEVADAIDACT